MADRLIVAEPGRRTHTRSETRKEPRKVNAMSLSKLWTRSGRRREETEKATIARALAHIGRLTAMDRCDRCGAQAYVRVLLPSRLELLFCAHHNRKHARALAEIAVEIQDETQRLHRA